MFLQELWPVQLGRAMDGWLADAYRPVPSPGNSFGRRRGGLAAYVAGDSAEIVVRESRYHSFDHAAPRWRIHEGDGLGAKGVHELQLQGPAGRFVVLHTHLQAPYPRRDYEEIRRRQLAQLRELGMKVADRHPVVVAGDLNTAPEERIYSEIAGFWSDLCAAHRPPGGGNTCLLDDGGETGWIDHLLAQAPEAWTVELARLELITSHAVDDPYSDHHGLHGELVLRRTAGEAEAR